MRKQKKKGLSVAKVILILAALVSFAWFCIPIFWGIFHIGNMFGMLVSIVVVAYVLLLAKVKKSGYEKMSRMMHVVGITVGALCAGWVIFLSGCMISGANSTPPETATVVVLGCQVKGERPTANLQRRIDAAAAYLKAHPKVNCVASGGKGDNEEVAEAKVIADYLVKAGISPERIAQENRSTNTVENLQYSLEIIEQKGWSTQMAIVTDDYHEFRAGKIAGKLGVSSHAVSAKTPWYTFPACYGRELLALTQELLLR